MAAVTYPVHVDATLDLGMSRWLWLVKWLLVIPQYFVLAFLWIAFIAMSIVAFFAILFTGRYPRSIFEFNVGVLRWTWRVSYYSYGALGTDRYPPFTLKDVPDYPAHFDVAYPEQLSRGLVLVKWWLLAIPQYVVVGFFVGGGIWAAAQADNNVGFFPGGLIGILVLVAAVALGVTGAYPQQIFDFVLGMNRWVLRVAAYASLMTDEYPPFRLDMGGHEPVGTMTLPAPPPGTVPMSSPTTGAPVTAAPPPGTSRGGWTAGRVVSLVIGSILALAAIAAFAAGGLATWLDNSQRDAAGFLSTGTHSLATDSYALTSDQIDFGAANDVVTPSDLFGTIRVRATPVQPGRAVFIGIAPTSVADAYLTGVRHATVTDWSSGTTKTVVTPGGAPRRPPVAAAFWSARTAGFGTQTLTWRPTSGQWVVVVMNASGRPGVAVDADVGATFPDLVWWAVGLIAAGVVLAAIATVCIVIPVNRAGRDRYPGSPPVDQGPTMGPPPPAPGS